MGVTANYSFPYPELSDAPNGPVQIGALATAVDTALDTVDDSVDTLDGRVDVVEADMLTGVVARHRRTSSSGATTATTAATADTLIQLDSVSLLVGRLYSVRCPNIGMFTGLAAVGQIQITYTSNGSPPLVTSTQLAETQVETPAGGVVVHVGLESFLSVPASATYRFLVSYWGNGEAVAVFGSAAWPLELMVEDLGTDPGSTGIDV